MGTEDLKLSPKHGVNPSVMLCFFCNESMGVALLGLCADDKEAPRQAVFDRTPCDKCVEYMKQGIILISVKDEDDGIDNPYRTGGWVVVKDELIKRMVTPEKMCDFVLKQRMAFVPDSAWRSIGLPPAHLETAHVLGLH